MPLDMVVIYDASILYNIKMFKFLSYIHWDEALLSSTGVLQSRIIQLPLLEVSHRP